MSVRINSANIQKEVIESDVPVILEFYSDSCIPCKALSPVLGDIEDEYEGRVKVCKVNVNIDRDLAEKYEVMAAPTMLFFENGKEIDRVKGIASKDDILDRFGGL